MERSLVAEISKTGWVPPGALFRAFGSRCNIEICQVASMIYYAYGSAIPREECAMGSSSIICVLSYGKFVRMLELHLLRDIFF
jgi:hypothetical protein